MLADGRGVPIAVAVDGANRVDLEMARETLQAGPIDRPGPGGRRRHRLCLDKGYDYAEVDALVEEFGFTARIARRGEGTREVKRSAGGRRGGGWWGGRTAG